MLLWTESWAAFGQVAGLAAADALRAAGYVVSTDAAWRVGADPIVPGRNALIADATARLGLRLPTYAAPRVVGFPLHVPLHYEAATNDASPILTIQTHELDGLEDDDSEIARVRADLAVGVGNATPQAGDRRLRAARTGYIEIRLSLTEIRVWLDDVLVLQHNDVLRAPRAISLTVHHAGTQALPFAIGGFYVLDEVAPAPSARLGRLTRVVGERPAADVSVQLERPAGYASNAAVAAQDLVSDPDLVLQGDVGQADLYSVAESPVALASAVHAVAVKARARHLGPSAAAVRAIIAMDGTSTAPHRPAAFQRVRPFTSADLLCAAWAPGDGWYVGTSSGHIWRSVDGRLYDGVGETPSGTAVLDIARIGSVLVAVCEDGSAMRCDRSSGTRWTHVPTAAPGALRAVASNGVLLMAVGDGGAVLTSAEGLSWASRNAGLNSDLTSVIYGGGYWQIAGSLADGVLRVSLNNGSNWLVPAAPPVIGGPVRVRVLDGRIIALGAGAIASRLALAGHDAPLYAATKVGGFEQALIWRDCVRVGGLYLAVSTDGRTVVSEDVVVWQRSDELGATMHAMVGNTVGTVLAVGAAGAMFVRDLAPAAVTLSPEGGYGWALAVAPVDPRSGAAWVPGAAAQSQLGVALVEAPLLGQAGSYLLLQSGMRLLWEDGSKIQLEGGNE